MPSSVSSGVSLAPTLTAALNGHGGREREMRERGRIGEMEVPETVFLSLGQFRCMMCMVNVICEGRENAIEGQM